ncbi:PilW family protein [Teredinibacter purpureus]|jgi:prepilin-type N-terminal cleavage/methylation domain|uniref:PilW family protein n=1 Tax=Teredinibacter purpureus TaxID=2731756 RepID=UPI0009E43C8B|nr:PilW family protein [Teredinibacter purpureus]
MPLHSAFRVKKSCTLQTFGGVKTTGLTLIELLVSMAIGAIILSGSVVVYVDQLQTSRQLTSFSTLQESGRVALDIIEHDIRMSGFTGCFSTNEELNNTLVTTYPASFQPEQGIQGWEAKDTEPGKAIDNILTSTALVRTTNGDWTTSGGNSLDELSVVPNSDIIRVWGAGESDILVNNLVVGTPNTFTVSVDDDIDDDAILMLSDCESVDIVQACAVSTSGTTKTVTLNTSCSPGNNAAIAIETKALQNPTVTALRGTAYLVSKQNNLAINPPSLFRAELDPDGGGIGEMQEVVQGVESLQILYGENLDDDNFKSADAYVTANNVSDWRNVVSVRVTLLLQSVDDNLASGVLPYVFNGVNYDGQEGNPSASDNRLRRVFSRTITLRNRTLGS